MINPMKRTLIKMLTMRSLELLVAPVCWTLCAVSSVCRAWSSVYGYVVWKVVEVTPLTVCFVRSVPEMSV